MRGWKSSAPLLLLLPAALVLAAVVIVPLILSFYSSFTPFRLTKPETIWTFIGFRNYAKLLADWDFWVAFLRTVVLLTVALNLEMLLGLLPPSSGTIRVLGGEPHRGDPRIGYVPQNYTAAVGEAVRCRDLVTLGMTGRRWGIGRTRRSEADAVASALFEVGAETFADQRMSAVSGGRQQRIAIAQGLVHQPELLLLDEPLANLDIGGQHGIVQLLGDLARSRGITVLLVTHDLNPLLPVLTGAVYLLDGHAHYDEIGNVVDEELLSHLYGTSMRVRVPTVTCATTRP